MKAILEIKENPSERLFAVGDIHGCYGELLSLERKLAALTRKSGHKSWRLLSVGDLCDRGPDTKNVFERFSAGKKAGSHEVILGNHESYFLLAFSGLRPDLVKKSRAPQTWYHAVLAQVFSFLSSKLDNWRQNGGSEVFKSYGAEMSQPDTWDLIPIEHIRLLFEAPLAIKTDKSVLTHALATAEDLRILEACDQRGDDIPLAVKGDAITRVLWARKPGEGPILEGFRHISGHTPMENVTRLKEQQSIQIDTGAVYGHKLTALDLNSFRTIQIQSKTNVKSGSPR